MFDVEIGIGILLVVIDFFEVLGRKIGMTGVENL